MFLFPLAAVPSRITTYFRAAELLSLVARLGRACAKHETEVKAGNRTQSLHIGNLGEPNDLDPHIPNSQNTCNII